MAANTKQQCPTCGCVYRTSDVSICPTCALDSARLDETSNASGLFPRKFCAPLPSDLVGAIPNVGIESLIDQGGMGAVYLARHDELDLDVAVKLLPIAAIQDPRALERFDREAKILASFQHPNIVSVIESGQTDSYAYIVMELVEGCSLRGLLCNTPLSTDESLATIATLCS